MRILFEASDLGDDYFFFQFFLHLAFLFANLNWAFFDDSGVGKLEKVSVLVEPLGHRPQASQRSLQWILLSPNLHRAYCMKSNNTLLAGVMCKI